MTVVGDNGMDRLPGRWRSRRRQTGVDSSGFKVDGTDVKRALEVAVPSDGVPVLDCRAFPRVGPLGPFQVIGVPPVSVHHRHPLAEPAIGALGVVHRRAWGSGSPSPGRRPGWGGADRPGLAARGETHGTNDGPDSNGESGFNPWCYPRRAPIVDATRTRGHGARMSGDTVAGGVGGPGSVRRSRGRPAAISPTDTTESGGTRGCTQESANYDTGG